MKTYEGWIPWWVLNPDASCTDNNDAPASDKLHVSKYPLSTNPKEIGKHKCYGNTKSLRNIRIIFN